MRIKYLPLLACLPLLVSCSDKKATPTPAAAGTAAMLPAGAVSFPNYGFSINSFDSDGRPPQFTALDMQVLPVGSPIKFPNVTVQLHTSTNTLAEFLKQMREDFAKMNVTIVRENTPAANEATVEYIAITKEGIPIHWYTRLIHSGTTIYLAVAMALDYHWTQIGDRLKACVDSLALSSSGQAPVGDSVSMPNYGFRIAPFDLPLNSYSIQPVMMMLPPDSGFSPSVNVQIQTAPASMDTYVKESKNQMQANNYNIASERTSGNEWFLEYLGAVQVPQADGKTEAKMLRWYAHAIWANGRVYLSTGGVPDELWPKYSSQIKACVDSLKIVGAPIVSAPTEPTPAPAAPTASGNAMPSTPDAGNATPTPMSGNASAPATP